MKLTEATSLREDLTERIKQLQARLLASVKVVKGSQPAEKPEKLYKEMDLCLKQLKTISVQIEMTSAHASHDAKTLTQLLAEQRIMDWRVKMMKETLETAIDVQPKGDVQYEATIDTVRISRQIETLEELKREIDVNVQSLLYITELETE